MPEEFKPVKTYLVDCKCPKCLKGYLRPNGKVLTSSPPQIVHECNNAECDYTEPIRNKSYPYFDYKPI